MNLLAILSVSGLRIVLYVGKLYNFAYVAIVLNYANLSMFILRISGFITFLCRNSLHFQATGWGRRRVMFKHKCLIYQLLYFLAQYLLNYVMLCVSVSCFV